MVLNFKNPCDISTGLNKTCSLHLFIVRFSSLSVCVAEWLRSPPLMREGLGSTPKAGKLDSGYHPSEVGEMSSNY